MSKVFEFNKQEEKGKAGERSILKAWPDKFEWFDGDEYDLVYNLTTSVEVKTETRWTLQNTPNFFMERYSDDIKFKSGGPWRAEEDNVDVFISYFIQNDVLFWFDDVQALVKRCEEGISEFNVKVKYINNGRYNTIGYPIRRYWFKDLYKKINIGDSL